MRTTNPAVSISIVQEIDFQSFIGIGLDVPDARRAADDLIHKLIVQQARLHSRRDYSPLVATKIDIDSVVADVRTALGLPAFRVDGIEGDHIVAIHALAHGEGGGASRLLPDIRLRTAAAVRAQLLGLVSGTTFSATLIERAGQKEMDAN